MNITPEVLEALGITKEDVVNAMVARFADDEDGYAHQWSEEAYEKAVRNSVDAAIAKIGAEILNPKIVEKVEAVRFQYTNVWGEPKKEPQTFREFLAERMEVYLTEKVDHNGRNEQECRSRGDTFRAHTTRVVHLVEKHLLYHIKVTSEKALEQANSRIADGIAEAVKMKLSEIMSGITVNASVKK